MISHNHRQLNVQQSRQRLMTSDLLFLWSGSRDSNPGPSVPQVPRAQISHLHRCPKTRSDQRKHCSTVFDVSRRFSTSRGLLAAWRASSRRPGRDVRRLKSAQLPLGKCPSRFSERLAASKRGSIDLFASSRSAARPRAGNRCGFRDRKRAASTDGYTRPRPAMGTVSRSESEDLACGNDDREAPESAERHNDKAPAPSACAFDIGPHGVNLCGARSESRRDGAHKNTDRRC